MDNGSKIKLLGLMLDCRNHHELAKFYAELLEWEIVFDDEEYAGVCPAGTVLGAYPCITFQLNPGYQPPVWPDEPEAQQQMAHLDFAVKDFETAVKHAISCGAKVADKQFSDKWRVMLDPEGHPFCLCLYEAVF